MRKAEGFLVAVVFLVIALAVASNYSSTSNSITGFASVNPIPSYENVSKTILSFSEDQSFDYFGDKALFCFVVEMDNQTTYYYELVKYNGEAYVKESYCADPSEKRLIVKFNSYEDLIEFKNSPRYFITEKRNLGYYLFPSSYIIRGGNLRCSEDFKEKYCGGLFNYFSGSEIKDLGVPCCANYKFSPTGMAFVFGDVIKSSGIFLIMLISIIIVMLLVSRKKKIRLI